MKEVVIRCWIEPGTGSNVVTVYGTTKKEAKAIMELVQARLPEGTIQQDGRKSLYAGEPVVIVHHYLLSGDEVELISHSLSHDELLEFIPEPIRKKSNVQ